MSVITAVVARVMSRELVAFLLLLSILFGSQNASAGGVQGPGIIGTIGGGYTSPDLAHDPIAIALERQRDRDLLQLKMDFVLEVSIYIAAAVLTPHGLLVTFALDQSLKQTGVVPSADQPVGIVRIDQALRIVSLMIPGSKFVTEGVVTSELSKTLAPISPEIKAVLKALGYLIKVEGTQ